MSDHVKLALRNLRFRFKWEVCDMTPEDQRATADAIFSDMEHFLTDLNYQAEKATKETANANASN